MVLSWQPATTALEAELQVLAGRTEEAIKAAHERNFARSAINWGDLGVLETFRCESAERTWYCVVIEEASPDNWEFQKFIAEELAKAGWDNVEVRTEW
jgi:hypothetical protein